MWTIIELIFALSILLLYITEFFYPLLANKPLFGSFRKLPDIKPSQDIGQKTEKKPEPGLEEKISTAKVKVQEVKQVQNEVTDFYKSAERLKEESDDLLN